MEFNEVLQLIFNTCPYLSVNEYDGLIVQKLAATNTISNTGASHQSHMAFTGKRKDIFPFLTADGYFNVSYNDKDDDLKKYYTLRIPLYIYSRNVELLKRGAVSNIQFEDNSKLVNASVIRSRRDNAEDQIELSIKSLDDDDFISFRKLLKVGDFFVILKRKKELLYDLVGLCSDDLNSVELIKCTDFYKISGSQTPVDLFSFSDVKMVQKSKSLNFPHNRIIFGAPGTGKSFQLNKDSEVFLDKIADNSGRIKNFYSEAKKFNSETNSSYKLINLGFDNADLFFDLFSKFDTHEKMAKELDLYNDKGNLAVGSLSFLHWGADLAKEKNCIPTFKAVNNNHIERVTFHPHYSYAQFVGTYKPVMKTSTTHIFDENEKYVMEVLTDKIKTAQEKYNLLYDKFKAGDLTRLPILIGLYSDEDFKTLKQDGTPAANDNSVEKNHGKAIRPYVNLLSETSNSSEISYSYVPGPFIRVLEKALYSQQIGENEPYLLIIEEINRANVAAVFGDVFQLLDRNENNESQYEIDVSEDLYNYLTSEDNEQTGHKKLSIGKKLRIPSNMYIWATMNSADQGVMPMDAAFKRRWDFEYIDIDANEEAVSSYIIPITKNGKKTVLWNDFRKALNEKLSDIGINEDKLLGPFFMSKKSLENAMNESEKFVELFESKVIMYLFEDVVKMQPKKLFNVEKLRYSKICEEFESKGMEIFGLNVEVTEVQ